MDTWEGRYHHLGKYRDHIRVPQELVKDPEFPFQHGDKLRITFDRANKSLIIEHAPHGEDGECRP